MRFRSLNAALSVSVAATALACLAIAATIAIVMAGGDARERLAAELAALRDFHKTALENRFDRIESSLAAVVSGFAGRQAIDEFEEAVYLVDPSIEVAFEILRRDNAGPGGADAETDTALYRQAHEKYDPFFKALMRDVAANLALIEPNRGYVVYSTAPGVEIGRSTVEGAMKRTALGRSVDRAMTETGGPFTFTPFAPYPGAGSALSSFIARPVMNENGVAGVVALQAPFTSVTGILSRRPGGAFSALVFLVDANGEPVGYSVPGGPVALPAVGGEYAVIQAKGSGGEALLRAVAPLSISGLDYFIVAQAPVAEAMAPLGRLKLALLIAILPSGLVAAGAFLILRRRVAGPIAALADTMKTVAATGAPPETPLPDASIDEIGRLVHLVNDMNERFKSREMERTSRDRSHDRYAESLAKEINALKEEVKSRNEELKKSGGGIAALTGTLETARAELDMKKRKLRTALRYLKDVDEATEIFVSVTHREISERIDAIARRVAAAPAEGAKAPTVMNEVRALERIIDRAIASLSLESDQKPLSMESFDIASLVTEATERMRPLAAGRGLIVTLSVPGNGIEITADRDHIRVAVENLIENAINYTPKNGSVDVTLTGNEGAVRFSVRDTGRGVEKNKIQEIFEKFHRIEGDSAQETAGAGLGLYVCRKIVRRHDGKIGAESKPGVGSLFYFELPKKPRPVQKIIPGL